MTRDVIEVQYPVLDHTEKVANISIETTKIKDGISIPLYRSSQLFLTIVNNGKLSDCTLAGSENICIELTSGVSVIRIADLREFVDDEYMNFDFKKGFNGYCYVTGVYRGKNDN